MESIFPFGFPSPTAFYLTLYVLALVLHVLFMNYVLAGTAYLAVRFVLGNGQEVSVTGGQDEETTGHGQRPPALKYPPTIAGVLTDWMPAMLSGAITAGVAPLLFLQILYQREFYTANLLLFNRWMSILPVLIIGFYALYVLRSHWLSRRSAWIRLFAAIFPFACVAYVAYSWTENHLLSVEDPQQWRAFYATGRQVYYTSAILPRLMIWACGSLPTLCVWLGWQLWYRGTHSDLPPTDEHRRVARLAMIGLCLALVGGGWYYVASTEQVRALLTGRLALPYFVVAAFGLVAQAIAWILQRRASWFDRRWLTLAALGVVCTVVGMTVCREVVRLDALGSKRLAELYPLHAAAANVEGFPVFLTFVLINGVLIALCFVLVRSALGSHRSRAEDETPRSNVNLRDKAR
jgi:Ca2+/Na+ antiporter